MAAPLNRRRVSSTAQSKASNPPKMEFFNASKLPYNTIHANDFEFFKEIDHVIQKEPLDCFDPKLRGLLHSSASTARPKLGSITPGGQARLKR